MSLLLNSCLFKSVTILVVITDFFLYSTKPIPNTRLSYQQFGL